MVRYDIAMPSPMDVIADNSGIFILCIVVVVAAVVGLIFIKKSRKKG